MKKLLPPLLAVFVSLLLIGTNSWAVDLLRPTTSTPPTTLTPIPLKPAVTTSTSTQSTDAQTSFINTDDFSAVVATVFKDARFTANSCGGESTSRKTVFSIPGLWFREEGMERLEYALTSNERNLTNDGTSRLVAIRSCFKYWRSLMWGGMVANGKFILVLQLVTDPGITAVVEDRGMVEMKDINGAWFTMSQWGDTAVDSILQDYKFGRIRLEIRLTPAIVNGLISYSAAETVWVIDSQGFDNITGRDVLISPLKIKIVDYKDRWLEAFRIRIMTPIGSPEVMARFSAAITEKFRAKHGATGPIKSITGVIGNGNIVTVQHN